MVVARPGSAVVSTADSKSEHKADEATADTTMLFQADGSLEPSKLTVKVGEVFTFGLAKDNTEFVSVRFGCGEQTVYTGPALVAYYVTTPGTYDISSDVADDKKLGTVTVE